MGLRTGSNLPFLWLPYSIAPFSAPAHLISERNRLAKRQHTVLIGIRLRVLLQSIFSVSLPSLVTERKETVPVLTVQQAMHSQLNKKIVFMLSLNFSSGNKLLETFKFDAIPTLKLNPDNNGTRVSLDLSPS